MISRKVQAILAVFYLGLAVLGWQAWNATPREPEAPRAAPRAAAPKSPTTAAAPAPSGPRPSKTASSDPFEADRDFCRVSTQGRMWMLNGRGNLRAYGREPRFAQVDEQRTRSQLNSMREACGALKPLGVAPLVGEGKYAGKPGEVCVSFRFGDERGTVTLMLPEQQQALSGLVESFNHSFASSGLPRQSLGP